MDEQKNNEIDITKLEQEINFVNEKLEQDIKQLKMNNLKKEIILEELLKAVNNN